MCLVNLFLWNKNHQSRFSLACFAPFCFFFTAATFVCVENILIAPHYVGAKNRNFWAIELFWLISLEARSPSTNQLCNFFPPSHSLLLCIIRVISTATNGKNARVQFSQITRSIPVWIFLAHAIPSLGSITIMVLQKIYPRLIFISTHYSLLLNVSF